MTQPAPPRRRRSPVARGIVRKLREQRRSLRELRCYGRRHAALLALAEDEAVDAVLGEARALVALLRVAPPQFDLSADIADIREACANLSVTRQRLRAGQPTHLG